MTTEILNIQEYFLYGCEIIELPAERFTGRIKYVGNRIEFEVTFPYRYTAYYKTDPWWKFWGTTKDTITLWLPDKSIRCQTIYEEVIVECTPAE